MRKLLLIIVVVAVGLVGWRVHNHSDTKSDQQPGHAVGASSQPASASAATTECSGNKIAQAVIVSISKQHLWACSKGTVSYDSAVITGMQTYASELTPLGTYKIYAKQTNQTLAGHDFTGSWSDFVYYWMPFLNNQYGTYGFHDLTQTKNGSNGRADSDFGNIDINAPYTAAKHASHGCVETPLATSRWLYNWVSVGTTVKIVS